MQLPGNYRGRRRKGHGAVSWRAEGRQGCQEDARQHGGAAVCTQSSRTLRLEHVAGMVEYLGQARLVRSVVSQACSILGPAWRGKA